MKRKINNLTILFFILMLINIASVPCLYSNINSYSGASPLVLKVNAAEEELTPEDWNIQLPDQEGDEFNFIQNQEQDPSSSMNDTKSLFILGILFLILGSIGILYVIFSSFRKPKWKRNQTKISKKRINNQKTQNENISSSSYRNSKCS